MTLASEVRLFKLVLIAVTLIPLVVGPVAGVFGLEGFAALFGDDDPIVVSAGLRNHLRAIVWMFLALAAAMWWMLGDIVARGTGLRIVLGFAIAAGVMRLIGRFVDGSPGPIATAIMAIEFLLVLVLFWHVRLVRKLRAA